VGMETRGNFTEGKYDTSRVNEEEKSKTKWKNNKESSILRDERPCSLVDAYRRKEEIMCRLLIALTVV
jgi:hypothetical protein